MVFGNSPKQDAAVVKAYFGSIGRNRRSEAQRLLVDLGFPDGVNESPSPRAEAYVESGEWDSPSLVCLYAVDDTCCGAPIGNSEPRRICIKDKMICQTAAHQDKSLLNESNYGFRIGAGTKTSDGALLIPCLPFAKDGGPVSEEAAYYITNAEDPVRNPRGQWKLLMETWFTGEAEADDDAKPAGTEEGQEGKNLHLAFPQGGTATKDPEPDSSTAWSGLKPKARSGKPVHPALSIETAVPDRTKTLFHDSGTKQTVGVTERPPSSGTQQDLWLDLHFSGSAYEQGVTRLLAQRLYDIYDTQSSNNGEWKDMLAPGIQALSQAFLDRDSAQARSAEVDARLYALTNLVKVLEGVVKEGLRSEAGEDTTGSNPHIEARLQRLEREVVSAAKREEQKRTVDRVEAGELQELKITLDGALRQCREVRQDITSMTQRMTSGSTIDFHATQDFATQQDFELFFRTEGLVIACAADGFLLLHNERNQVHSEVEAVSALEKRHRAKLNTEIEAASITSFTTSVPSGLAPSKASVGNAVSTLQLLRKLMAKFSEWEDDSATHGLRFSLDRAITNCRIRIESFRLTAELTPKGEIFCSRLTSDSETFALKLINFVTTFYTTMQKTSGLPDTEIWEICLEMLAAIIDELAAVRNVYVDSAIKRPHLYFWGMLRAWEIQQRYLTNKFIDDPALNGIFTRRAVLRKKDGRIDKLEADLRKVHSRLAAFESRKGPGKGKAGNAAGDHDE